MPSAHPRADGIRACPGPNPVSARFRRPTARDTMSLVEQRLGVTDLEDGTKVQFAVVGRGPVAIYVPGWVSHLELGWAVPAERLFYEGLADGRTLVRYDRPG